MDKWCMIAVMKKSKQLRRLCVKFYFKRVMKWVSRCIACYKNLLHKDTTLFNGLSDWIVNWLLKNTTLISWGVID